MAQFKKMKALTSHKYKEKRAESSGEFLWIVTGQDDYEQQEDKKMRIIERPSVIAKALPQPPSGKFGPTTRWAAQGSTGSCRAGGKGLFPSEMSAKFL